MSTISRIRNYIAKLGQGMLFTTRELLHFGKRTAIDQALSRLNRIGRIERLARGVYQTAVFEAVNRREPTLYEIAEAKMKAWGKSIMTHARDAAQELGLTETGNAEPTFFVSGCTTSFTARDTRIRLRSMNPKAMGLGNSRVAGLAKALWSMGKQFCEIDGVVSEVYNSRIWKVPEKNELRSFANVLPSWLVDQLIMKKHIVYIPPLQNESSHKTSRT